MSNIFSNNSPVHCVTADTREIGRSRRYTNKRSCDMVCGQRRIFNAISACASVPVKALLLPGGHLQAIVLLTTPNSLASSALFPQDQLQHSWKNHRLYLIQHQINLFPCWGLRQSTSWSGVSGASTQLPSWPIITFSTIQDL